MRTTFRWDVNCTWIYKSHQPLFPALPLVLIVPSFSSFVSRLPWEKLASLIHLNNFRNLYTHPRTQTNFCIYQGTKSIWMKVQRSIKQDPKAIFKIFFPSQQSKDCLEVTNTAQKITIIKTIALYFTKNVVKIKQ